VTNAEARNQHRRRELSLFLRMRRERITPEAAGLPSGSRRRTPGLRREEVAQLAGIGVSWYTWLEQARPIRVSAAVLDGIARALRLDAHERRYIFTLADVSDPLVDDTEAALPGGIEAMLGQLEPFPAMVENARFDVLAYNRIYARLYGDLDELPTSDRNTLLLTFCYPAWRHSIVDWPEAAALLVDRFRKGHQRHRGETMWKALLTRLRTESPDFDDRWKGETRLRPHPDGVQVQNPHVGLLRFEETSLWINAELGTRLVTYVPSDTDTTKALDRLGALAVDLNP
jgi:transcriptional regulator with XRE-family HTH domain